MAGDFTDHRLAPQYLTRGALWPRHPPDHLRGPGPPVRPAPGGGQPGSDLCPEHETRQGSVLRPVRVLTAGSGRVTVETNVSFTEEELLFMPKAIVLLFVLSRY